MKKILLISLILGTALAQLRNERNRIARLRRRQQLANLSEQELINGGFLQSGSSRLPDSFRGLEPSFDTFSRRQRFRANAENLDSSSPRRRDYLQTLRSSFRRNGSRGRRTYMPAIKRPRFTPNLQEIMPRRTPSYSPTARGVDSKWAPRIPSTVLGAGNFLPSNLNDFIERTNPVNDRSYVSPRKPSLIAEPIPLPSSMNRNHISTKDPISSLSTKPDYVAPKDPIGLLPLPQESGYVAPKESVGHLPLPQEPDYIAPIDPVNHLPLPHEPDYVEPKEPVGHLPLPHKPDYIAPKESVGHLPLPNEPDYIAPKESVGHLPLPNEPDYIAPKEPVGHLPLPHKPDYIAPKEPVGHLPLPNEPDYIAPKESVGHLPLPNEPDYVAPKTLLEPLPLPQEPYYIAPIDPVDHLPPPDYVAPTDPIETLPLPQEPGYVTPNDPILALPTKPDYVPPADLDASLLPNTPDFVAPLPSLPKIPFGPLDPLNIPSLPLPVDNPDYVPNIHGQSLDPITDTRPVFLTDPLGPLDPLDLPTLPVKDANYVTSKNPGSSDAFGPLDAALLPIPSLPSQHIGAKDPNYVEPSITVDPLESLPEPLGPIGPGIPINRPDYVDPLSIDPLNPFGPLGPLTPIDVLDTTAVSPSDKPGYLPPNDAFNVIPTGNLLGGPFDPNFPDPLSIQADAFLEPLVSIGGVIGDPSFLLTSSKGVDPRNSVSTDGHAHAIDKQAGVLDVLATPTEPGYVEPAVQDVAGKKGASKTNLQKGMVPEGLPSDFFGPLDLPQDPLGDHNPFSLLPQDSLSPIEGGSLHLPDIPPFSGPNDPLNMGLGGNGGLNDLLMHPEGYAPEPALAESFLFDSPLPPIPDLPPSAQEADIPGQLLTRSEINEAARREYAKSDNAFDPKWNNPNVRNSALYVKAKEVNPQDVRPAKIKTLFDFTPGAAGADVINSSVDRVSEKTRDLMAKALKQKEGYLTKYDALRSYEG
ncbi:proteoglycan 4-like [Pecten maximus]|uniref:proteoglycan 4-like n=1 Tax=Pecten maximus TaxID=6579 RepID=UPI0014583962|nr:proteoglycan 4-like [Pecten maximus]